MFLSDNNINNSICQTTMYVCDEGLNVVLLSVNEVATVTLLQN